MPTKILVGPSNFWNTLALFLMHFYTPKALFVFLYNLWNAFYCFSCALTIQKWICLRFIELLFRILKCLWNALTFSNALFANPILGGGYFMYVGWVWWCKVTLNRKINGTNSFLTKLPNICMLGSFVRNEFVLFIYISL